MSISTMSYILESGKWIQSDKLYPHDIALILDSAEKKIYLWEGPRATTEAKREAIPYIEELKNKFKNFEYKKLGDIVPLKIQKDIDERLDESFEETQKIDRTPDFKGFLIFSYICIAGLILAYMLIFGVWLWDILPAQGLLRVNIEEFNTWVNNASLLIFVVSILFEFLLIFAIITKKAFLIVTAMVGAIIELGTYRYVLLGQFLFNFASVENAWENFYYISISDVVSFTFLNIVGLIAILIPIIISMKAIYRDTIPISYSEWREKKKKQYQIQLTKASLYLEPSTSTPIKDPRKNKDNSRAIESKIIKKNEK